MPRQAFIYRFGPYELRPRTRELYKGGTKLRLRPQPFQILNVLVERAGDVVTREELHELLWSSETFVDFEHGLNTSIKELRGVLSDSASEHRYIETLPRLGYRMIVPVKIYEPTPVNQATAEPQTMVTENVVGKQIYQNRVLQVFSRWRWPVLLGISIVLIGGLVGTILHNRSQQARQLTDKDTIVLADFTNNTGDAIFDHALKQALSVELTQSPFLNVASDLKVGEMLRRMSRSPNDPLTREVAREVCLRLGGKAIFAGSISGLGSHYVVGLQVLGCAGGDLVAASQAEAANKESVLKALDGVSSQVRRKVGESLSSLEKYDFPLDTTTKSLEALRTFSMGQKALRDGGEGDAIPFFLHAIELDPDFALAYTVLGRAYENVGEDGEAVKNFTRGFELRDRLSEREKYHITTLYHETVTGDLDQARAAGELWVQTYPRDGYAREKLATVYADLGALEQAHNQSQEALRLDPESTINVFNSVLSAASINRFEEARQVVETARAHGLDGVSFRQSIYSLAFLRSDSAEMEGQVAWAIGKATAEELLVSQHSDTEAYYGRLRKAGELSKRAAEAARRDGAKEIAATCEIVAALREIEIGNASLAALRVPPALSLAPTREIKILAALALARAGTAHALALIDDLQTKNPVNTLLRLYWIPTVKASLEIQAGHPSEAVSLLKIVVPYELSETSNLTSMWTMYPVYVRGQAYLLEHNAGAAAAEFKKVLDHPGIVQNGIIGALSRLQLARAKVMMGDTNDGRKEYSDFLSLWKDADPDIPIFKQAKSEYARLK